jgi:hypothetical protein
VLRDGEIVVQSVQADSPALRVDAWVIRLLG